MCIHSRARLTIASLLVSYGNGYENKIQFSYMAEGSQKHRLQHRLSFVIILVFPFHDQQLLNLFFFIFWSKRQFCDNSVLSEFSNSGILEILLEQHCQTIAWTSFDLQKHHCPKIWPCGIWSASGAHSDPDSSVGLFLYLFQNWSRFFFDFSLWLSSRFGTTLTCFKRLPVNIRAELSNTLSPNIIASQP